MSDGIKVETLRIEPLDHDLVYENGPNRLIIDEADRRSIVEMFTDLTDRITQNAINHGFKDSSFAEQIALIHSELSEALEAHRSAGTPPVDLKTGLSAVPVELADAVIRIFHLCGVFGFDLGHTLVVKHNYNVGRPYMHGKRY